MSAINWRFLPLLVTGSAVNAAIAVGDSLLTMLYKLQGQINNKEASIPNTGTPGQFLAYDKTWRTPAGPTGPTGVTGNSLLRPTQNITSSSGVITIDLSNGKEVYLLTMPENITSWSFINLPAAGFTAEIRIKITQGASTAYTCVSPASAGTTAGGPWVVSSTLGAIESLGIAIDSSGNRTVFPSGVNS